MSRAQDARLHSLTIILFVRKPDPPVFVDDMISAPLLDIVKFPVDGMSCGASKTSWAIHHFWSRRAIEINPRAVGFPA